MAVGVPAPAVHSLSLVAQPVKFAVYYYQKYFGLGVMVFTQWKGLPNGENIWGRTALPFTQFRKGLRKLQPVSTGWRLHPRPASRPSDAS